MVLSNTQEFTFYCIVRPSGTVEARGGGGHDERLKRDMMHMGNKKYIHYIDITFN